MSFVVKLPDVGEGVAEAEIVEWYVSVGDEIAEDQALADVLTDKATIELPSPVAGTITRLGAEPGDVVPVGSELVWIDVDGDATAAADASPESDDTVAEAAAAEPSHAAGSDTVAAETAAAPAPAAERAEPAESAEPAEPAKPTKPGQSAEPAARAEPTKPAESAEPAEPAKLAASSERPRGGMLAAPAVRRRAAALSLDLGEVTGSGPDGRVVHEDLDALLTSRAGQAADSAQSAPAARPAPARADDDIERVKVIGLRRNIANRMQESSRRIPHFTYVDEVDVTELQRLREELNRRFEDSRPRLTVLPLLIRAVVVAVDEFPQVNARFRDDEGEIERHRAVHLGIATQTPKGLMVPVVHHADELDLWGLAAEISRLSTGARDGSLTLAELQGSTITITSLGALGGVVSTPVINYPEVAIIGVNKIVTRPVFERGAWLPREMMNLSSSFDHRIIDGWDAARFIGRIRELLESPALLWSG